MKWLAWIVAGSFALEENAYFGWNRWPGSDAELIADGIVATLVVLMLLYMRRT